MFLKNFMYPYNNYLNNSNKLNQKLCTNTSESYLNIKTLYDTIEENFYSKQFLFHLKF